MPHSEGTFNTKEDYMTALSIRELCWRDVDRLFQITAGTFPRDLEKIGFCKKTFKKKFIPSYIGKWIQKITKKSYEKVYVGELGGKVVGVACIKRMGAAWYLSGVMVDRLYRGKGYGREIVTFACESACSFGGERIILRVPEDKIPAKTLYHSLGFEPFETVIQYVRDCEHVIERALPEPYTLVRINDSRAAEIIDKCRTFKAAKVYGKSELQPWYKRMLHYIFQTDIRESYAITVDDRWTGVYTFRTDHKKKGAGYVSIDILPEHGGQGLEKALLTQTMAKAFRLRLPHLIVWANQENTELTVVCEEMGFSQREVLEGMFKVC